MRFPLLSFSVLLALIPTLAAAPSWESVYTFSEMKSVAFDKLEAGDVIGVRTQLEGSELSLGAESFYAVPLPPNEVLAKMNSFSTASSEASETLDITTHLPVSRPAQRLDFAKFNLNPESKRSRDFLKLSAKSAAGSSGINLSQSEKASLGNVSEEEMAGAWREILKGRATVFQQSGLLGSPPYEDGTRRFDLGQETLRALKSRPQILKAFAPVLDPVMAGRAIPNGKEPTFYWESSSIQGDQVVSLTGVFSQPVDGGYRVAETTYYSTGKYYVSLALYQLIPAEIKGRSGTVIYRSDFVLTPSVSHIKGIERIAAENVLLMEIKRSARSFITECSSSGR